MAPVAAIVREWRPMSIHSLSAEGDEMLLAGFDSFARASLKCRHYERPISQSLSP